MKLRKNIILSALLGLVLVFGSVLTAQAIDLGGGIVDNAREAAGFKQANETSFAEILGSVVQTALSFIGVIFIALMVYAGYLWMTARGEESEIDKAQDIIRAAIIGLIITLAAYSITYFIIPKVLDKTTTFMEAADSFAFASQLFFG